VSTLRDAAIDAVIAAVFGVGTTDGATVVGALFADDDTDPVGEWGTPAPVGALNTANEAINPVDHLSAGPMATVSGAADDGVARVDPRAPRFGQTLTAIVLATAIITTTPILVYALAVVMVAAIASGWRVDVYAVLWRRGVHPLVEAREPEPAAPHRFARLMGASGTTLAAAGLLAGVPLAGYAVAALIAGIAGVSAATGYCVGCRMYRSVSFFQRLDVV